LLINLPKPDVAIVPALTHSMRGSSPGIISGEKGNMIWDKLGTVPSRVTYDYIA
jgi:hypothetical protein